MTSLISENTETARSADRDPHDIFRTLTDISAWLGAGLIGYLHPPSIFPPTVERALAEMDCSGSGVVLDGIRCSGAQTFRSLGVHQDRCSMEC